MLWFVLLYIVCGLGFAWVLYYFTRLKLQDRVISSVLWLPILLISSGMMFCEFCTMIWKKSSSTYKFF